MHDLNQKAEDSGALVVVRQVRHDQSSTGGHQSLKEQGHGPRQLKCCGPGPAAHLLYWLEDLITQYDQHSYFTGTSAPTQELLRCVCPSKKRFPLLFSSPIYPFHRVLNRQSLASIFCLGTRSHPFQFLQ